MMRILYGFGSRLRSPVVLSWLMLGLFAVSCERPKVAIGPGTEGTGCRDDCAEGDLQSCIFGMKKCGEFDDDPCLDWGACLEQCLDQCSNDGERRCSNNGVETCADGNSDGCLEWSEIVPCGADQNCSNGECSCGDLCSQTGATRCSGQGYQECGNFDVDRCLEWSPERPCPTDQTCSGDSCSSSCSDDCTQTGAKRCAGQTGFQTCGQYDADACLDWSGVTNCAAHESCQNGVCAPGCSDECPTAGQNQCHGDGSRQCGNNDADACLEWGDVEPCKVDETCSNGICSLVCQDECSTGQKECLSDHPFASTRSCGEAGDGDDCLDWVTVNCTMLLQMCREGDCVLYCDDECTTDGERQCSGDGYQVCGSDTDDDQCLEWSPVTSCAPDFCSQGQCVSVCTDDCPTEGGRVCSGTAGYRTCGQFDADSCLDLSSVTNCGAGTTCQGGLCQASCSDACAVGETGCSGDNTAFWSCSDSDSDGCLDQVETSCPSEQTCVQGSCQTTTTTCTDDTYEENDTKADAVFVTAGTAVSGLQICAGDSDWYEMNLLNGDTLDIALTFVHADGDLDMRLYNADSAQLAAGTSSDDNEEIQYVITATGYHYLRVYGYGSAENTYGLSGVVTAAAVCTDDGQEENDSQAAAAQIAAGLHTGLQVCAGDDDWYRLPLVVGESVAAILQFNQTQGDLDLALHNAAGDLVDSSATAGDSETVTVAPVVAAADYFIRVYGASGAAENSYSLDLDVAYDPSCPDDSHEENDQQEDATGLLLEPNMTNLYRDLKICSDDVDWYEIPLNASDVILVDLTFSHAAGDLDVVLYDSAGNAQGYGNTTTDNEHLEKTITEAGQYFLRVSGFRGAENGYEMSIGLVR